MSRHTVVSEMSSRRCSSSFCFRVELMVVIEEIDCVNGPDVLSHQPGCRASGCLYTVRSSSHAVDFATDVEEVGLARS